MQLSSITAKEWIAVATPVAVIVAAIVQKLDAYRVKKTLKKATDRHDTKLDEIHGLVNSSMTEQKRIYMVQARRIATLTKDPRDIAMADEAEKVYEEHVARQVRVDAALARRPLV